jgi:hypothetical protein
MTLINFFFALAGSRLTKMTVTYQKTNNDVESIARHNKPVAEDKFQGDKDDFIEFFLRPCGQQLDKDNCCVTEDE